MWRRNLGNLRRGLSAVGRGDSNGWEKHGGSQLKVDTFALGNSGRVIEHGRGVIDVPCHCRTHAGRPSREDVEREPGSERRRRHPNCEYRHC
jgi:hypothetical protein